MPLGFADLHPGGMAENSPTFQRWDSAPERILVPKGRLKPAASAVPPGLRQSPISVPNVETLGYCRMSLRDKHLSRSRGHSGGSNPSGIDLYLRRPVRLEFHQPGQLSASGRIVLPEHSVYKKWTLPTAPAGSRRGLIRSIPLILSRKMLILPSATPFESGTSIRGESPTTVASDLLNSNHDEYSV